MGNSASGLFMVSRGAVLTVLLLLTGGSLIQANDDVDIAREWVSLLPAERLYTHGYTNAPNPPLVAPVGERRMVPMLAAVYHARAWETFLEQEDLNDEQRRPHHYQIGHEVEANVLTVVIEGLLLPRIVDGEPRDIMRVSLGPSMRLRYALDSGKLIDSHLLR
jgi:hypothetical protein